MRVALVHYHEIGLKGMNRGAFERRLADNLRWALAAVPSAEVTRIASRLLVRFADEADAADALRLIRATPGISYVGYGVEVERTPQAIADAAVRVAREETVARRVPAATFGIEARRSATQYAESSMEMNRRVGEAVRLATGLRVDLRNPDILIRIAVVQSNAYVYATKLEGPGGLPVGTAGPVVALLSAGIDSPVAAWRIIRRGASVVGVHFSGSPHTSAHSERVVAEIATTLVPTGGFTKLYTIPFGDVQRTIALGSQPDLRVLLYRRFMVRIAEEVARTERAKALVTGESLGQVASQTLDNVAVVDAVATLPVLRPLIGSDKQEIVGEARRLGTYDLSITADDDCCTLFMPRRPQTHARPRDAEAAEASLDVLGLVAEALAGARVIEYPSVVRPQRARGEARASNGETRAAL